MIVYILDYSRQNPNCNKTKKTQIKYTRSNMQNNFLSNSNTSLGCEIMLTIWIYLFLSNKAIAIVLVAN